jgi:hypothetical protein
MHPRSQNFNVAFRMDVLPLERMTSRKVQSFQPKLLALEDRKLAGTRQPRFLTNKTFQMKIACT